jgi:glycosyltransferase involved in cell wall biosynthesis
MKINIVCYEDPETWICGKIARRLNEALGKLGHASCIQRVVDPSADINHHVIYLNYMPASDGNHTLMVTHVDDALKVRMLERSLMTAKAAICASSESVRRLTALGVDGNKLSYSSIAHDGKALERKYVIGITTRLYPDGRKNERYLQRLVEIIRPTDFEFKIMGFGWAPIVSELRKLRFHVDYWEDFDYETYIILMSKLDYFLYLGEDEGSAAFVDALAAGVKTIVIPQGMHLDAKEGITHGFKSFEDLRDIFSTLAEEKRTRTRAVESWTWENYAKDHLRVWEACLKNLPVGSRELQTEPPGANVMGLRCRLWFNVFWNRARLLLNVGKDFDVDSRIWRRRRKRLQNRGRDQQ